MKRSRSRSTENLEFARSQRRSANEFSHTVWQWLLKQVRNMESVAMRRRMAAWNEDFLAQALGFPCT